MRRSRLVLALLVLAGTATSPPAAADEDAAAWAGQWQYQFRCVGTGGQPTDPILWRIEPDGAVLDVASGDRVGKFDPGKWGEFGFQIRFENEGYPPILAGRRYGYNNVRVNYDEPAQTFTGRHAFAANQNTLRRCDCNDVALVKVPDGTQPPALELGSEPTLAMCRRLTPPAMHP